MPIITITHTPTIPEKYKELGYIPEEVKKSLVWGFLNDDEPMPPTEGFMKGYPKWARKLGWLIRNFRHNHNHYVKGVCDKNFTATGECQPQPWGECTLEKWGAGEGLHEITLNVADGRVLKLVSRRDYRLFGITWEWYKGWGPKGDYGIAFRRAHATNAGDM